MIASWLKVCFGAYPLGAVTSQSLLDLSMSLLFLIYLIRYRKDAGQLSTQKKSFISFIGIEWAFLGYLFVIALGFIVNASVEAEIGLSFSKFIWMLNLYILIASLKYVQMNMESLIKFFSWAFLIPNIYGLTSYVLGYDVLTKVENYRIVGLVNSATYHAHANAVVFVFFLSLVVHKFSQLDKKYRLMALMSLTLFAFSIVLTFTRGIWLSIALSSLLLNFFFKFQKGIYVFIFLSLICFSSYKFIPSIRERINHSFDIEANTERLNLFKLNVQIWKEYPLLGIGFGENLRRNREYWDRPEWNMPKEYITSHAHNEYLNVLATTGVFGFIFFISFMAFFVKKNIFLLKQTSRKLSPNRYIFLFSCLWAQIEFLLACLTDVTFEYAKIRALLILVWALVIAAEKFPNFIQEEKAT